MRQNTKNTYKFYFYSLIGLVNTFNTEQKCIEYLEMLRWKGKIVSPCARISAKTISINVRIQINSSM